MFVVEKHGGKGWGVRTPRARALGQDSWLCVSTNRDYAKEYARRRNAEKSHHHEALFGLRRAFLEKREPKKPRGPNGLLRRLTAAYPYDKLAPGLVFAYLPKDGLYYASIRRYPDGLPGEVVHKAVSPTLMGALRRVTFLWETSQQSFREQLIASLEKEEL